jgi:DNA-binding PadR family transcriptional regulator
MNKPIFKTSSKGRGRPPVLQLKILKCIVLYGHMSKAEATEHCTSNYGDVSDAMDTLVRNDLIKFSGKKPKEGSRKHHKLYKLTEKGLRYLLETKINPDVFWKAVTLLCISSKKPITRNEFEHYYIQFERDYLGHFSIPGYFFLTHLFDDILEQWFQAHDVYSLSQKVIECLAFYGPLTMEKLIEETGAKQDDIIKAIDNYSTCENFSLKSLLSSDIDKKQADRKNIYHDFITHLLIIMNKSADKEKFELSLFGVLLAISLIRHHYESKVNANVSEPLFYQHINEKEYLDSIAQNYKDKIPLIFGKWEFLKAQLGQLMLYDGFDFLIYKSHKSNLLTSILLGGNKEFYDDIHTLTYNAAMKLLPLYSEGKCFLQQYESVQPGLNNNPQMASVYQKINNLGNFLEYTRFMTFLKELKEYPIISKSNIAELCELRDIRKIENIFGDEVCLLFYLDLNRITGYSKPGLRQPPILEQGRLVIPPETEEIYRLGSPKQRLMAILTKDSDIKEWFSAWIKGLIRYRKHTLNQMSEFYKEVNESYKNVHSPVKIEDNMEAMLYVPHKEFDMTKVCSDNESIYDY